MRYCCAIANRGNAMRRRKSACSASFVAAVLACATLGASVAAVAAQPAVPAADAGAPGQVHFGAWGVDLSARDLSARPGDDFERYASGHWLDTHDIPADKSQNSLASELNDRNQEQLQAIVTGAPADSQLGAFYRSYMDEARLERLDDAPLKQDLARIDTIRTRAEFTRYMASTFTNYGSTLFASGPLPDPANPGMTISGVYSNGMGMPDRDYYLDIKYQPQRDAYRAYIQRIFEMTGQPDAAAAADEVLAFETGIAKVSWPQTDLRDIR
jgi:putative endopeptidase